MHQYLLYLITPVVSVSVTLSNYASKMIIWYLKPFYYPYRDAFFTDPGNQMLVY